jgi:bifunctional DNase/RNase
MARTPARVQRLVRMLGSEVQYLQLAEGEQAEGARKLVMVIGRSSAEEIERCLLGAEEPRPMTHKLLHDVVGALGGRVVELEILALRDGTYFAELRLERDGATRAVDCRPSDGIALALRSKVPMFVHEDVWREAAKQG